MLLNFVEKIFDTTPKKREKRKELEISLFFPKSYEQAVY